MEYSKYNREKRGVGVREGFLEEETPKLGWKDD